MENTNLEVPLNNAPEAHQTTSESDHLYRALVLQGQCSQQNLRSNAAFHYWSTMNDMDLVIE